MDMKLNNKGFTLIELLAVLVILVIILGIAIPSISSSMERTKVKQNEARYKIIESVAEQYVMEHKNAIYSKLSSNSSCYLKVGELTLLSDDEKKDADGNDLSDYYVIFTKPGDFTFVKNGTSDDIKVSCINWFKIVKE